MGGGCMHVPPSIALLLLSLYGPTGITDSKPFMTSVAVLITPSCCMQFLKRCVFALAAPNMLLIMQAEGWSYPDAIVKQEAQPDVG